MVKKRIVITGYVNQKLAAYIKFMGIDKLPKFDLKIEEDKYYPSHTYNVKNDKHTLTVGPSILNMEAVLYHEFTHIYDVMKYSANDTISYASNRGFTEYHAGQIELLKLLGAKNKEEKLSFSLQKPIDTQYGRISVLDYILKCIKEVKEAVPKGLQPTNLADLSNILGIIFNHLGRLSICRLYAEDYDRFKGELEDLDFVISFFGVTHAGLIHMAKGILSEKEIKEMGAVYFHMLGSLMHKYKLG